MAPTCRWRIAGPLSRICAPCSAPAWPRLRTCQPMNARRSLTRRLLGRKLLRVVHFTSRQLHPDIRRLLAQLRAAGRRHCHLLGRQLFRAGHCASGYLHPDFRGWGPQLRAARRWQCRLLGRQLLRGGHCTNRQLYPDLSRLGPYLRLAGRRQCRLLGRACNSRTVASALIIVGRPGPA